MTGGRGRERKVREKGGEGRRGEGKGGEGRKNVQAIQASKMKSQNLNPGLPRGSQMPG
jgi:hypothetical protein